MDQKSNNQPSDTETVALTTSKIRNTVLTENYMISGGEKEPLNWKDYAIRLEEILVETSLRAQNNK